MYEELLEGAYDLHVHSGPDVFQRKIDDIDLAERFRQVGMKGYAIKSHYFCTAERARLVNKIYPEVNVIGTITLNYSIGGINPLAVELAARDGAKLVWMPTFDALNERRYFLSKDKNDVLPYWAKLQLELKEQGISGLGSGISILEDGKLTEDAHSVLEIISKHQLILATGHLSKHEIYSLVKAAKDYKVKKIVITHPTFSSIALSVQEQKELAQLGAYMEHSYGTTKPQFGIDYQGICEHIRYVGPEHCILGSDGGQPFNPNPDEALQIFAGKLLDNGFSKEEIKRMTVANTTYLVEG